jgi:murein DD-endopeptidase MepM/ murein hydrolase activator NlpD
VLAMALFAGATVATVAGGQTAARDQAAAAVAATPRLLDDVRVEPPARTPADAPSDTLTWPLHGAITGRFGEQRGGHAHAGIDIPKPIGTPIRAAAPGRVVMAEEQSGYGNYTCVAHRRILTCYAHQKRFRVKKGQRVSRGQVIGYVGNTGNSGAVHLHFEVRRGTRPWGTPVNPVKYLPRG